MIILMILILFYQRLTMHLISKEINLNSLSYQFTIIIDYNEYLNEDRLRLFKDNKLIAKNLFQ